MFLEIQVRIQQGMKKNQAIKEVAKIYQWNKSQLYAAYHDWEETKKMTKQGSLPSSLFCYTSRRKIRRFVGVKQSSSLFEYGLRFHPRGISVVSQSYINVIGAGLAGSEAAYQIAERGIPVKLYEMRGVKSTPSTQNR